MHRLRPLPSTFTGFVALLLAGTASAGPVSEQFRGGAFGLPWNAGKKAIEARYPAGKWDRDENGAERYCAPSRQPLLGLPAQHQTRELCFLIGGDGTLGSATARLDATLPSLLAIVNRSAVRFFCWRLPCRFRSRRRTPSQSGSCSWETRGITSRRNGSPTCNPRSRRGGSS